MRVTDEMFQLILTYLPYQAGDENLSLERGHYTTQQTTDRPR
jgi:hypothetical protein